MGRLSFTNLWRDLGSVRFRTNLRYVAMANIGAQVLLIISAPILSRLFEPSDFGVLALYVSLTSLIVAVATLRFDWLIPNAYSEEDAIALFCAGGVVLFLFTLGTTVLLFLFGEIILFGRYSVLLSFKTMIPLGVLGLGLHQLYHGLFVRRSDLLPVSKTKIVQSAGNVILSLILGLIAFGGQELLFAVLISSWLGISILHRGAPEMPRKVLALKTMDILKVAGSFKKQALLSTAVSGLNVASSQAVILLLALVYPPAQVGLVAFAHRLMAAPIALVAQALAQSFWAHASDLAQEHNYKKLRSDYLKITCLLTGLAITIGIVALIVQPLIVPLFGPEWIGLGGILTALLPLIWGATIVSPTNHLVVLRRQGLQLYADILRLALVILAAIASAKFEWNFTMAVFAVALSSLLGHVVLFLVQLILLGQLIRKSSSNMIGSSE